MMDIPFSMVVKWSLQGAHVHASFWSNSKGHSYTRAKNGDLVFGEDEFRAFLDHLNTKSGRIVVVECHPGTKNPISSSDLHKKGIFL